MRLAKAQWKKIGELIMVWAQDDGTCDDLAILVDPGNGRLDDKFWTEFSKRITKAFG